MSGLSDGFVEVLAAQQTPENPTWFQGTADAVRQYMWLFSDIDVDEYVILSGDHLYRMDYSKFVQRHRDTNADITLSVVPMDDSRASDFGLMKLNDAGRVVSFSEKPKGDDLKAMQVDTQRLGLSADRAAEMPYIASMGIYVFKKEVLIDLLKSSPDSTDFGKEIIPDSAKDYNVQAYLFDGYWEDIGTIKAFYDANLGLTSQPTPPFTFYDKKAPIYTRSRYLPPTKMLDCQITESMISEGCMMKNCQIQRSVLGVRSRLGAGSVVDNSLLMGADYYERPEDRMELLTKGKVPVGVGSNCLIKGAIVDKNARIGNDVKIINKDNIEEAMSSEAEAQGFIIRSGIPVILKNATIPDGTVI